MLVGILLFSAVVVIAMKLADLEDRNPWLWGLGTAIGIVGLIWGLGMFSLFAYVLGLVGVFVALWIAKAIDDKRAGRPF